MIARTAEMLANGFEAHAAELMAHRDRSCIGVATVLEWARRLPEGASVLDLGCGHGVPLSAALMVTGFRVLGGGRVADSGRCVPPAVPGAEAAWEAVEESTFFGRTFDGAIAVGLMFLLPAEARGELSVRVASVLKPGGRFLFTAPAQPATWDDLLTGLPSRSLGSSSSRRLRV